MKERDEHRDGPGFPGLLSFQGPYELYIAVHHLSPWGIGARNQPKRTRRLTLRDARRSLSPEFFTVLTGASDGRCFS
jgi:hypothetical protein